MKLEHVGIAVKDLEASEQLYTQLLGARPYKRESVESESVVTSFFMAGESKIELLGTTDPEGPIGKFLASRGEGIHHLAFEVDNLMDEIARLKELGFEMINEQPKRGADNKLIAFLRPATTGRVLVELCQSMSR